MTGIGRQDARTRPADPAEWLTDDEQAAWRAYLASSRLLEDALDADLQEYGLTLGEYEILALLSEEPDRRMRMSALAARVIQSRSAVSHTAARLERRGLVTRRPAEHDKRGVDLHLTGEGLVLVDVVAPHHVASVRHHLLDHLGPDRVPRFGAVMEAVRDGIRAGADPDSSRPTS